jgi:glycerophosphoryl diester phosphodiesterase
LTIIGHRAGCSNAPENTLQAYKATDLLREKYAGAGVTVGVECDSRMSKDGVVVTVHDESFQRVSGVEGKVSETDSTEFPNIREGPVKVEFGGHYEMKPEDERTYCTLEKLYQHTSKDLLIQMEIKDAEKSPLHVRKVVQLVKKYDR